MHYSEWQVDSEPGGAVRCIWTLQGEEAESGVESDSEPAEPALPDGCPELIFNFGDPFEHVGAGAVVREQPRCFLVGQITEPFIVRPTGTVDLLAVRFDAHGAYGLYADLSHLTNTWASAEMLRDSSLMALWHALHPQSVDARRETVQSWLSRYGEAAPRADLVVRALVQLIRTEVASDDASRTVQSIAETHGVSLRTVQRRFQAQVGVSPKLFSRIVRFHRVCVAWRNDPDTLARVAADCGYYDESHLVRDFRAFVGEPPVAFLNSLAAFTTLFLSKSRN